jgi:hypothetical protein
MKIEPIESSEPLYSWLSKIGASILEATRESEWLCVEVSQLSQKKHLFFTLTEHDASGFLVANARALLWSTKALEVQERFRAIADYPLAEGMKVRMLVKGSFHPQFGVTLVIREIMPMVEAINKNPKDEPFIIPEGITLKQWLLKIGDAVKSTGGHATWVTGEMLKISNKDNLYLLGDRDSSGQLSARLHGMISPGESQKSVLKRLRELTGKSLAADMHVRMRVTASFDLLTGLKAIIDGVTG